VGVTYALGLLLSACLTHGPISANAATDQIASVEQALSPLVDLRQIEVRVRKLHVVRPDLLQYPLPYDVIC
jgi:hypothetical protein